MSAIQPALKTILRNLVFNGVAWPSRPTTAYLALLTTVPDAANSIAAVEQPFTNGYARLAIVYDGTKWTVTGASATNAVDFNWPNRATADWAASPGYGIYSAATGGSLLWADAFTNGALSIAKYERPKIAAGLFNIVLNGAIGTYLAQALLNHWLLHAAWTAIPNFYVGLGQTGTPDNMLGEPQGPGFGQLNNTPTAYTRALIAASTAKWPIIGLSNQAANNVALDFPQVLSPEDWTIKGALDTGAMYDGPIINTGVSYVQTDTVTLTVTKAAHNLTTNQMIDIWFTSGAAPSGRYPVTVIDSSHFTITVPAMGLMLAYTTYALPSAGLVTINKAAHGLTSGSMVNLWFASTAGHPLSGTYPINVANNLTNSFQVNAAFTAATGATTYALPSSWVAQFSGANLLFQAAFSGAANAVPGAQVGFPANGLAWTFD